MKDKLRSYVGIAFALGLLVSSTSYLSWQLYKIIDFKVRRPEIMQQIYQAQPCSEIVNVRMAVKQDPFWKYPERMIYQGDREIFYKKLQDGEWQMEEGVWTTGPNHINEFRFKTAKIKKVTQKELPGNPENALEILVDLDAGEEYAQGNFKIEETYEKTEKKAERWASNMKPLLLQNYNHLLKRK